MDFDSSDNSDARYFGKLNPLRLTSLEEGFKAWRAEMKADDLKRELKRAGKLPEPEITRERFPEEE